jgi:hypothetical protein
MLDMRCRECSGAITVSDDGPCCVLRCSRCGAIVQERTPADDRAIRHTDLVDLLTEIPPAREYIRAGATLSEIDQYTRQRLTQKRFAA